MNGSYNEQGIWVKDISKKKFVACVECGKDASNGLSMYQGRVCFSCSMDLEHHIKTPRQLKEQKENINNGL